MKSLFDDYELLDDGHDDTRDTPLGMGASASPRPHAPISTSALPPIRQGSIWDDLDREDEDDDLFGGYGDYGKNGRKARSGSSKGGTSNYTSYGSRYGSGNYGYTPGKYSGSNSWGARSWEDSAARSEVTRPLVGYYDDRRLRELQEGFETRHGQMAGNIDFWYQDSAGHTLTYEEYSKGGKADGDHKVIQQALPDHIAHDIYTLFVQPTSLLRFVEDTDQQWRVDFIQQLSHYFMRTVTVNNPLAAFLVTKELLRELYEQTATALPGSGGGEGEGEGEGDGEEGEGKGKGKGKSQNPGDKPGSLDDGKCSPREALEKLSPEELQALRDRAFAAADKKIDEANDKLNQLGIDAGSGTNIHEVEEQLEILDLVETFNLDSALLKKFIQQCIKGVTTYYSQQYTARDESFLECESLDDMQGLAFLHPSLHFAQIEDVTAQERKFTFGMDVYIDCSGSMSSPLSGRGYRYSRAEQGEVSCLVAAKVLAIKLCNARIAQNVHFFDDAISPRVEGVKGILKFDSGGGTNTERVVQQVIKSRRPGIVITDMQDHIATYTKDIFFIGIGGAKMYNTSAGEQFTRTKQFATFNGKDLVFG